MGNDQGVLATVKTNTGEVARFSDGTTVLRARPETNSDNPNPHFKDMYRGGLQPPIFKNVFMIDLTVSQVIERLENSGATDGMPVHKKPAHPPRITVVRTIQATPKRRI